MSADKVQEAWDAYDSAYADGLEHIRRCAPTDALNYAIARRKAAKEALVAAVREDEKARCIAAVQAVPVHIIPTHDGLFAVTDAIRNA